jgi:hypothetical protein
MAQGVGSLPSKCEALSSNPNTTKRNFEKRGRKRNGNTTEGVKLFKIYYIYEWNYHNEIPLYY